MKLYEDSMLHAPPPPDLTPAQPTQTSTRSRGTQWQLDGGGALMTIPHFLPRLSQPTKQASWKLQPTHSQWSPA